MRLRAICIVFSLIMVAGTAQAGSGLVGIVGDIHGDFEKFGEALARFKEMGVEYIIGTGDYVGIERMGYLPVMRLFAEETSGVPKENRFLVPGNWDEKQIGSGLNASLQEYGALVAEKATEYGRFQIEGVEFMLGHYPIQGTPEDVLNDYALMERKDPPLFNSVSTSMEIPEEVEIIVVAHTHRAYVYSPRPGLVVVNVGAIDTIAESSDTVSRFGVIDLENKEIQFLNTARIDEVRVSFSQTQIMNCISASHFVAPAA